MCAMRVISKSSSSTSTFSHADTGSSTPILSYRPPTSSPLHIVPTTNIIPLSSLNMKDTSTSRHSRNNPLYPKRRPSPNGVTKSRKSQSPLTFSVVAAAAASRRSPRAAKMESVLQRRRELQLAALRREGILLEDEYREEIRYYMYEMEVRWPCFEFLVTFLINSLIFSRGTRWAQLHQWTSNQKSNGKCAPASSNFSSSSTSPSACAPRHYI
jgi:hypothetical protein